MSKVGRNQPCPCGSGKKYKKCHGVDAKAIGLNEVAKIGPRWISQMVTQTLKEAQRVHKDSFVDADLLTKLNWLCKVEDHQQSDIEEVELEKQELGGAAEVEIDAANLEGAKEMTESGEIRDSSTLSILLRDVALPTTNRRDRRLFSQLKLSLSQSVFEPLEILEVLRGSGFKVKGCFSDRIFQINQPNDTSELEPMEWIYGRVIVFGRRCYLLEGWEKINFRGRKALKAEVLAYLGEDHLSLRSLRNQASWLLESCRKYRLSDSQETSA